VRLSILVSKALQFSSMDPEQLASIVRGYGMAPGDSALAEAWLEHCGVNKYYAQAYVLEGSYQDYPQGLFVVCSTAQATRQNWVNVRQDELHERILEPEYFYHDVWFFPGVVPLNWRDCTHGGILVGRFEDLLDRMCMQKKIHAWRQEYAPRAGEYHNENLQRLLVAVGINGFVKITAGLSMQQFRCLDVYTRIQTGIAPLPDYEAWDIVGMDTWPARDRRVPEQHEWWYYPSRLGYGQRSIVAEWHLSQPSALRILCDRYAVNQREVLQELFMQCEKDPIGLYQTLRAMTLSPSMDPSDVRMELLKQSLLTTSVFRAIPRAIEDKKHEQIARVCRASGL